LFSDSSFNNIKQFFFLIGGRLFKNSFGF